MAIITIGITTIGILIIGTGIRTGTLAGAGAGIDGILHSTTDIRTITEADTTNLIIHITVTTVVDVMPTPLIEEDTTTIEELLLYTEEIV